MAARHKWPEPIGLRRFKTSSRTGGWGQPQANCIRHSIWRIKHWIRKLKITSKSKIICKIIFLIRIFIIHYYRKNDLNTTGRNSIAGTQLPRSALLCSSFERIFHFVCDRYTKDLLPLPPSSGKKPFPIMRQRQEIENGRSRRSCHSGRKAA